MNDSTTTRRLLRGDWLALSVILVATLLTYAPMIHSIVQLSTRTTQAVNAFVLLAIAVVDAVRVNRGAGRWAPQVNDHGVLLYGAACLVLAAASFADLWPMAVLALILNLAALLSFCYGREGVRAFYPALIGLGLAVAMVLLVPQFDRVLRLVAGGLSARILSVLGENARVIVRPEPFGVALIVAGSSKVFNVATECNGLGIMLSAVVLTAILAIRRKYPWLLTAALLPVALGRGLVCNTLRIVAISLASMALPWPYGLIHEGVGTLVYCGALLAVYGLTVLSGRWRARRLPA